MQPGKDVFRRKTNPRTSPPFGMRRYLVSLSLALAFGLDPLATQAQFAGRQTLSCHAQPESASVKVASLSVRNETTVSIATGTKIQWKTDANPETGIYQLDKPLSPGELRKLTNLSGAGATFSGLKCTAAIVPDPVILSCRIEGATATVPGANLFVRNDSKVALLPGTKIRWKADPEAATGIYTLGVALYPGESKMLAKVYDKTCTAAVVP